MTSGVTYSACPALHTAVFPAHELTSDQVGIFEPFCVKMPRRYHAICADDRERIVQVYRNGGEYVRLRGLEAERPWDDSLARNDQLATDW